MYTQEIMTDIQNYVNRTDGSINFKDWTVALSSKGLQEFATEIEGSGEHLKKIEHLDANHYNDLVATFEAANLKVIEEKEPINIFLYKSNV